MQPATLVDGVVIFQGGASRPLNKTELSRLEAGEPVTADPRSGRRTPLAGETEGAR